MTQDKSCNNCKHVRHYNFNKPYSECHHRLVMPFLITCPTVESQREVHCRGDFFEEMTPYRSKTVLEVGDQLAVRNSYNGRLEEDIFVVIKCDEKYAYIECGDFTDTLHLRDTAEFDFGDFVTIAYDSVNPVHKFKSRYFIRNSMIKGIIQQQYDFNRTVEGEIRKVAPAVVHDLYKSLRKEEERLKKHYEDKNKPYTTLENYVILDIKKSIALWEEYLV